MDRDFEIILFDVAELPALSHLQHLCLTPNLLKETKI